MSRGGSRPGSGRRPNGLAAKVVKSYTLDPHAIDQLADWQRDRGSASASAALAEMVDTAWRVARGETHACPSCGGAMRSWRPGATCLTCRNRKGADATNRVRRVQTSAQLPPP